MLSHKYFNLIRTHFEPVYLRCSSKSLRQCQTWSDHRKEKERARQRFSNSSLLLAYVGISLGGSFLAFEAWRRRKFYGDYLRMALSSILLPPVYAAKGFFNINNEEFRDDSENSAKKLSSGNRKNFNFIADAVSKVSHAVVYIEIKDMRRRDYQGNYVAMSNGSGFVASEDGLILTNAHVVMNRPRSSKIMVRLKDEREFEGVLEEVDAITDLALVRIKASNLKPVVMGSSTDLQPGEFVVALGSPLSLSNTITAGVVSSVGRHSKDLGLRGRDIDYIQTDAAITFGNSGGPLVNLDGEVIGINSMKVTSGISFAIPIDHAKTFLDNVKKKQSVMAKYKDMPHSTLSSKRRYLGITMLSLTPEILLELQTRSNLGGPKIPPELRNGILIWRVVVGSPAYHAGLQQGDIITHINSHDISNSRDVYKILEGSGDLSMVIMRNGQRFHVTVSPEE